MENITVASLLAKYFNPSWQKKLKKKTEELHQEYEQFQVEHAGDVSDHDQYIETATFDFDEHDQVQAVSVRDKAISSTEIKLLREFLQIQAQPEHAYFIKQYQKAWGISREEIIEYVNTYLLCEKIATRYKEQLLPTQNEVERFFPQGLPPLFLSLDEWHHPDWALEEPLSQCETFQMLARAIESGRAEDYAPALKPNTDWRLWVEE